MRIELAGHVINLAPPVPPSDHAFPVPSTGNVDFKNFKDLGYTHFDVICIGGAGGPGGGVGSPTVAPETIQSYGGAGGGGGIHRASGLLSALPDNVFVRIGSAGIYGQWHDTDPSGTTDGGDGGYSSFNNTTCVASGGKGGRRVQVLATNLSSHADGGQGGIGGTQVAGGGGAAGIACIPKTPGTPSDGSDREGTNGADGTWDGTIGQGGGGGAGGVAWYHVVYYTAGYGTNGGKGAYNPSDLSVMAPGQLARDDTPNHFDLVIAGGAGGAAATPLNGIPNVYGCSGTVDDAGTVVIFLSAPHS